MSGRTKRKIKDRFAKRVLSGKVTAAEARRGLSAAGVPVKGQKTAPVADKSAGVPQRPAAGTDMVTKSRQALTPQQRNYLAIYDTHPDPAVREAAFQAAYPQRSTS